MKNFLYTYIICITTVLYTNCNGNNNNSETLKQAVSILQSHPDSALKMDLYATGPTERITPIHITASFITCK
ncbi:hypothetical protein DXC10_02660 [Bacteroides sp. OM08-11]|nr:hypothetical protein DXC10_02660 [Bacteroides sp. OM08-11]